MEEVDETKEIVGNDSVQDEENKSEDTNTDGKETIEEVEVNGRKYKADKEGIENLAKDTQLLTQKIGKLGDEVGELRKFREKFTTTDDKSDNDDLDISDEDLIKLDKINKKLGYTKQSEIDSESEVKALGTEITRVAAKYGVEPKDFATK
ncbi:MAG: hypothetical protein ACRDFB_05630, partial [Rhabdochlamydiaceae bacterium]